MELRKTYVREKKVYKSILIMDPSGVLFMSVVILIVCYFFLNVLFFFFKGKG
jgi:hypothetical protein